MSYVLLSESCPKARKDYKCIWCGQKIMKGDVYYRRSGVWEGSVSTDKWHPECEQASAESFRINHDDEFDPYENERPIVKLEAKQEERESVMNRLEQLQNDKDTGKISEGHVCKHGIRYPHECRPCADDAWERHQLEQKVKREARGV